MGKFQLYGSKKLLSRGRKIIREMHILSSDECDSFLRSPIEVLKNFSWDKVMRILQGYHYFAAVSHSQCSRQKAFCVLFSIITIEVQTSAYESHSACYICLIIW